MAEDTIFIDRLRLNGIIGVNPHERVTPQPIVVSLTLTTDITAAGQSDNLAQTISYSAVAAAVRQRVTSGSDRLVETLALDLARLVILNFGAQCVRVRVEKPAVMADADSVGVEIVRCRADFAA